MLSKALATLFAAAVLAVGGYAYWQYANGPDTPLEPTAATGCCSQADAPPCCQTPTRASCALIDIGSCCEDPPAAAAEVLTVAPREVE